MTWGTPSASRGAQPVTAWEPRRPARAEEAPLPQAFEERHYPVAYWAGLWGFSAKTVREWFLDEYGSGILRQSNTGRRSKRDYTTIMVSASAAARVYANRTGQRS